MYDKLVILIPTYNPSEKLIKTIEVLKDSGFNHIIVVNDGSINNEVFNEIEVDRVLKIKTNKGKGVSLKTGFEYLKKLNFDGVITVDDDLQQDIVDIKKMADSFIKENGIYFGVRDFDGAPFIRKTANKFVSKLFKLLYKFDICDTQTGLRCFPKSLFDELISISGDRFEYEMNVLKYLVKNKYNINMINIKTIYNDNKSHYSVFIDSFKIIKALLKK
ncbi:MAG: glycosyltransferase family 2 protein [Bacilli bacterium]|nr:glycosyltransferase family 2 protein [Bacilli bacterium]